MQYARMFCLGGERSARDEKGCAGRSSASRHKEGSQSKTAGKAGGFVANKGSVNSRFYFRFNCEISRTAPRSADVANAA